MPPLLTRCVCGCEVAMLSDCNEMLDLQILLGLMIWQISISWSVLTLSLANWRRFATFLRFALVELSIIPGSGVRLWWVGCHLFHCSHNYLIGLYDLVDTSLLCFGRLCRALWVAPRESFGHFEVECVCLCCVRVRRFSRFLNSRLTSHH